MWFFDFLGRQMSKDRDEIGWGLQYFFAYKLSFRYMTNFVFGIWLTCIFPVSHFWNFQLKVIFMFASIHSIKLLGVHSYITNWESNSITFAFCILASSDSGSVLCWAFCVPEISILARVLASLCPLPTGYRARAKVFA